MIRIKATQIPPPEEKETLKEKLKDFPSKQLTMLFSVLLIASVAINIFQYRENGELKSVIETCRVSNETLIRLGDELFLMRSQLRMPSKVMEALLPEVVRFESGNNPNAVGDGGRSHGAAQVQFLTGKGIMKNRELTVADLYNPYVNPFLASEYLEDLYLKYRDVRKALSAYNGGLVRDSTGTLVITNPNYVNSIKR